MGCEREIPLLGHLLMILVRGFALRGAIEFQDGVDTDFPDALGKGGLLCAEGEFPLVFAAAEFAFDGDVRAFGVVKSNASVSETKPTPRCCSSWRVASGSARKQASLLRKIHAAFESARTPIVERSENRIAAR